ncbi:uroporphyrinogen decarboxylase, partial [bacterium]|nr:uroporphyrinogen decarboxylase [bacterium]
MSLYLDAARCIHTPRPPIWMMRQAGRYLPEYREIRERHGFKEMIKTPDIAAEITMQPIRRFGFDAAILFSDILTVAEAVGSRLQFVEKKGPVIENPVGSAADVAQLTAGNVRDRLVYVSNAIRLLKESHLGQTPLIGFAGAPFTVASYMIEGGSSPDLRKSKNLIFSKPEVMEELIDLLVRATAEYLNMQIEAGVDAIQIFDTWAGHLSAEEFSNWVHRPIRAILNRLRNPAKCPVTVFCKGSAAFWPSLATLPINVVGLDWQVDIGAVGKLAPPELALQGNLDPFMLYAPAETLINRVQHILESMADRPGY